MVEWFLNAGIGFVFWIAVILLFYWMARSHGASQVKEEIQKQKNKDDKRLKEVADEADRIIATGDSVKRMRNNGWLRKQR